MRNSETEWLFPSLLRLIGTGENWAMVTIGRVSCLPELAETAWNQSGKYALNLVLSGYGELDTDQSSSYELGPGKLYQHIPEAKNDRIHWNSEHRVDEWYLVLDQRLFSRLKALGCFPEELVMQTPQVFRAAAIFEKFYYSLSSIPRNHTPESMRASLSCLVEFLTHIFGESNQQLTSDRWSQIIQQAKARLEEHTSDRAPLPELAKRLGVSYSSLRRIFRKETGMSLSQFAILQRINEAKVMLEQTDVSTTSASLGYPDPFSFSAQFKKVTGISPRDFQNQQGHKTV